MPSPSGAAQTRGGDDPPPSRRPSSLQPPASSLSFSRAWSVFCVAWAAFLLLAGANVTSNQAGLSIPDWPTAYGVLLPDRWAEITNVRAELLHRFIAAAMGLFTIVLAVAVHRSDARAWVRRLGWAALVLVVAQGVLGGLNVLTMQPWITSVGHASLAQAYFCVLVTLAVVLSPRWSDLPRRQADDASVRVLRAAAFGVVLLFVQLVLGALARHNVLPREVHAAFALPVVVVAGRLALLGYGDLPRELRALRVPCVALGAVVLAQVALGAWTYYVAYTIQERVPRTLAQVVAMNLHLVMGAVMLGTTLLVLLRTARVHGLAVESSDPGAVPAAGGAA